MKISNIDAINKGFGNLADEYDLLETTNSTLKHMRESFQKVVLHRPYDAKDMLELNCGTGTDALFFAQNGFEVLATDISEKMLDNARAKVGERSNPVFKKLDINELHVLNDKMFDVVVSNFGGLNCLSDFTQLHVNLRRLIKSGGYFIASLMPSCCLWELLLLYRCAFKKAFRRFSKEGTMANLGGHKVATWYYSPASFYAYFKSTFSLVETRALRVFAPPPDRHNLYNKFPKLINLLEKADSRIEDWSYSSYVSDHYIIVLKKMV